MTLTKVCTVCGIWKPAGDFYHDGSKKNGLRSMCKLCETEYHANHLPAYRNQIVAPRRFEPTRGHFSGSHYDGSSCHSCPMREDCIPLAANLLPVLCEQIDDSDVRVTALRFGDFAPVLLGLSAEQYRVGLEARAVRHGGRSGIGDAAPRLLGIPQEAEA